MVATKSWTAAERAELARLWPRVLAGGLSSAAVAQRFGRTLGQVWAAARRYRFSRRRRTFRRYSHVVRKALAAGRPVREVARRLGLDRRTVQQWARRLGLTAAGRSVETTRARRRRYQATCQRHGVESYAALFRERRLRAYAARGYPAGVSTATQAAAVDVARRTGGVTRFDLPCHRSRASTVLAELVLMGVLIRCGQVACRVATRQRVTVYTMRGVLNG